MSQFAGRVTDKPPEPIYCAECNLLLAEREKDLVVEGQKVYHGKCHDIRRRKASLDPDPSDSTVFIGLAVVVIGYFFA